ncbi:MAG: hypothetical protein HYW93_05295 [Thaumarchaeota archaeon]|nr:hypothetical protein [Nitrososphaerota archaeon]
MSSPSLNPHEERHSHLVLYDDMAHTRLDFVYTFDDKTARGLTRSQVGQRSVKWSEAQIVEPRFSERIVPFKMSSAGKEEATGPNLSLSNTYPSRRRTPLVI